jgi:hypothetical protein
MGRSIPLGKPTAVCDTREIVDWPSVLCSGAVGAIVASVILLGDRARERRARAAESAAAHATLERAIALLEATRAAAVPRPVRPIDARARARVTGGKRAALARRSALFIDDVAGVLAQGRAQRAGGRPGEPRRIGDADAPNKALKTFV